MAIWKKKIPHEKIESTDDLYTRLAKVNGITDLQSWLRPPETAQHSPYLLDNIEVAADRIINAIDNNEIITVFYDVDADGVCAGTIMFRYLNSHGAYAEVLYNQRYEGHGIATALDRIPEGTQLLLIVDSSTNDTDACKQIQESGIDIIILDHHEAERENPYCILVNNQTCAYPNKHLSGAGMAYKMVQVLDDRLGENEAPTYIDLAGLGIYGDVMDMTSLENRYFVYQAIKNIMNPGLQNLLKVGKVTDINSMAFGFNVVPMINASARMNRIELVIKLLASDDFTECTKLAKECQKLNDTRKKLQKQIADELEPEIDTSKKVIICVTDKSNKGFNGLIATQIASDFQRPCIIVKEENGLCEGSARSYGSLDLKSFLDKSGLFEYAQGHAGSFGLGFKTENLDKINDYIEKNLQLTFEEDILYYDLDLEAENVTAEMIQQIQFFSLVSGKGFPQPRFLIKDFEVEERSVMGKNRDTVKLVDGSGSLVAMKFKTTETFADETEFSAIDILGTLNINKFYHPKKGWIHTNQVFIEDFKVQE